MRRGRTEPSSRPTVPGGPHPIACTAPYDWEGIRAFLAARAVPGLERVTSGAYARTISLGGRHGTLRVREAGAAGLIADLRFPDPGAIPAILARIGRLFDVAADRAAIGAQLSGDPDLARLVSARPGLRVPGAWDGFELGVRAILGQQVSVTAATLLAAALVATYGPPLAAEAEPGLSHVFPAPQDLAEADISRALNMPRARGAAIRSLAAAAAADPTLFAPGQGLAAAVARLTALRGIGPWTAQYIAMRALREPDALPPGDIGLLRALETGQRRPSRAELLNRAEGWRPWRAYAAMHLWAADADSAPARCGSKDRDAGAPRTGESAASRGADGAPSEEMAMPITDLQTETRAEDDAGRWAALASRDRRADGQFVYAVRTTGIYCRPSCAARAARPENVRFHPTCEAAEAAGFRPCKRCRPNEAAPEARQAAAIARACRLIETAETLPVLDDLARAAGIHGIRVEDPGELEGAAREVFAHDGPALLDVVVNRQELSIPPKIDGQQVKGFSLYVLRAVMSGRGDAVLDLAKSNLIR
ncbi:hypothetical protein AEGHOMDF_1079 [Methylobacterium soli]|uniref:Ada metal-binding domain-containing protein n=1 Tax=Methylobacterium soli TaxID=553447 RepID=UPI001EE207C0|nr:AlkA N-terminal domain-containing protein [Methylobacterium soli]GJE41909.1 hypothetical protein AEGHOMDF_1079 [Methylobacterium soli]